MSSVDKGCWRQTWTWVEALGRHRGKGIYLMTTCTGHSYRPWITLLQLMLTLWLAERAQRVKPLSVHLHWDLRYMSVLLLLYVQLIPEAVAMVIVMAGCRLRGRGFDSRIGIFFFHSLFFLSHFPPFFFLHVRSAISMLKHFSSNNSEAETAMLKGGCIVTTSIFW